MPFSGAQAPRFVGRRRRERRTKNAESTNGERRTTNGTRARPVGDASRERAVSTIADVVVERLTALGPARIGVNGNSTVLRNPRADRDPKTVARETHASFLVAGHLQTKDGRLSLLMHIIRLDDGTHVWVQRLSRSPDDALETLDEDVAAQIEKAVRRIVLNDGAQAS